MYTGRMVDFPGRPSPANIHLHGGTHPLRQGETNMKRALAFGLRGAGLLCLVAALVVVPLPANAALLVSVDPTALPSGHGVPSVSARFQGQPEWVEAGSTLFGGYPWLYSFIFECDAEDPTWVEELALTYECGEEWSVYTMNFEPWSMLCIPGLDNNAGVIDFGTDPLSSCFGGEFIVDDLRIRVSGQTLVLDWTHAWCTQHYNVYRLDHPWQPFDQATFVGFADDNHFELPLDGSQGYFRVTSLLCD